MSGENKKKELKYKKKHLRKSRPFFKWLFFRRKYDSNPKASRIQNTLLTLVFGLFTSVISVFEQLFINMNWGVNFILTFISLYTSLFIIARIVKSCYSNDNFLISFFSKVKKSFLVETLVSTVILKCVYITWVFSSLLFSLMFPIWISLIISTIFLFVGISFITYEIEIDDDALSYELGKDELREMRLKELLRKGG